MDTRIEFLYLSEPDTIAAGVNDAAKCVDVSEEVFKLLAQGDYLMGGSNHNSHGMGIIFPKETRFPNMPVAGPDRRFFAMPAYLGGRFDVCGNKWYGSNAANTAKGFPRSILTVMLNDKDTGAPLCLMSANLLSAARTGAVPGVAARHLARKDSGTAAVIGCGPINKSCFNHIMSQVKNIKKVYCYDIFEDHAKKLANWANQTFGIEGIATLDIEEALKNADVVTVAASRLKPLHIKNEWIKRGASVLLSGPALGDEDFWTGNRIVLDHIGLHEAYVEEAIVSGDKQNYYNGVIGGPIYRLIDDKKLPPLQDFTSIGQIILGEKDGRTGGDETFVFVACGMAVFDVGWGYEIYQNALRNNIGQKLLLWDKPAL
jgi:ornithine cyclodeaminase/alanine dehydrogenase-like protein (mu-crystallin family)